MAASVASCNPSPPLSSMGMAERNVDPAMMMLLGRLRDDIAVIERLAKDAINGEYEQSNGGLQ